MLVAVVYIRLRNSIKCKWNAWTTGWLMMMINEIDFV